MLHADVERIRNKADIVDLLLDAGAIIDDFTGTDWKVFCPFHVNINTPAGSVSPMKQLYNCFSCGARGDVIDIARLMLEQDGKPNGFKDAISFLEART